VTPHDFPADVDQIAKRVVWYLRTVPGCHTAAELCNALHINSRDLQYAIQWARSQGNPELSLIGSGDAGYWWILTPEEVRQVVGGLYHRMGAIGDSARGMLKAAGQGAMQEELKL